MATPEWATMLGGTGEKMKSTTPADTGVDIYDSNGGKVGNVPYGTGGITGSGETVYRGKDENGNEIFTTDAYKITPTLTLDDATGKITLRAPKDFFGSEVYNQYLGDDVLRGLGNLYIQDKNAKVEMADGTQKTVKEVIEAWNKDLPKLVAGQKDFVSMKEKIRERLGDEAANNYDLKSYQIQGMSAYSGRDEDFLTIPQTILNMSRWSFLKELSGFDPTELAISKKDFTEGYYHLDALRDTLNIDNTSIAQLKKDASNALANYQGNDADEFARLIAFNNYLNDQTAEGASNAPDGSFTNKVLIGGAAVTEGAIRATAQTGTNFANFIGNVILLPVEASGWVTSGFTKWQWVNPVDGMAAFVDYITGGDGTLQGYKTATGFLEAEYAKRGQFYELTNGGAKLAYTLSYYGVNITETFLQAKAMNRIVLNTAALGISKAKVAGIAEPIGEAYYGSEKIFDAASGEWKTPAQLALQNIIYPEMVGQGTPAAIAGLITKQTELSFFDTLKLLSSVDPSAIIGGAYAYSSAVNQAAEVLSSDAFNNLENFREWYEAATAQATTWQTLGQLTAEYNKYRTAYEALWSVGTQMFVSSAKALKALGTFAKYVPTVWYTSQVVLSTALSESGNIRRLMDGVDSNEERDYIWQMIGRTAAGWAIGIAISKAVNAVANRWDAAWMEKANAKATEKIAQAVNWYEERVDQVHEIIGGSDWVDNLKNPQRKAAVKYNQSLSKSQEYMAKAGDAVRMAGGSEAEAISAVMTAKAQKIANDNAIDLKQNPELIVAAWHSPAYPAYANASETFTGVHNEVGKRLKELGLDKNIKTTALIAGMSSNGDLPQDIVNYQVRALQRASYLRDDYDYSSALVEFGQNLGTMDVASMYILQSPSYIRERDIAIKYMEEIEAKYPASLTNYIKDTWAPAAQQAAFQLNQVINSTGYYLKAREEGWKQSGMFGLNNQLWFPMQRVTDAQKDFEEATRNPMNITKSGVIKRRFYEPEHYSPGSDEMTDFVNPMITFRMYEFQQAVEQANRNFVDVNLQNPYVKHITRLDGEEVGAVKTYNDLAPSYEKGVKMALDSVRKDLDVSGLVSDMLDKQKMETKIRNAQKAVDKAKETWDNIPNIEVKVTRADQLRTIEGLPEDTVDTMLQKAGVEFDGEKVDVRKWLNSQVPGFDVLDWSLLGRTHTNGLVEGGLYSGMGDTYVKAYIMDLNDLRGITKLDKNTEDMSPDAIEKIRKDINTEGGEAVIPLYFDVVSGEKRFFPQTRWGHSGDRLPDWETYFNYLASKGITKVPVAIAFSKRVLAHEAKLSKFLEAIDRAIATGKKPEVNYKDVATALRELGTKERVIKRLRDSAPEEEFSWGDIKKLVDKAEKYNVQVAKNEIVETFDDLDIDSQVKAMMRIHNYFKDFDVQDITSDVQQAFAEYGQIPFYHGQHAPLGSMEYNDPEGAREPYRGAGDAYWLAPNSSYTDTYGKNKLAGNIPIKYFMSDKEKSEIAKKMADEENKIVDKAIELGRKEFLEKNKQIEATAPKEILSKVGRLAEKQNIAWDFGLKLAQSDSEGDIYIDGNRLAYKFTGDVLDSTDTNSSNWKTKFTFKPLGKVWESPANKNEFYEKGKSLLPKKDLKRLRELQKLVDIAGKPTSYRAFAEYAKKPVIDISEDDFASGTAFFYYKGVDPEFDKKIGQQLASQAMFQNQSPQWTGDVIANAMEDYDGMSIDEMIDYITMGEGWGEDWDMALEDFENGEISSSELTEDFQERVSRVAKKYPGIAKVMRETWDNNSLQDLRDMKFQYWHPSTGYPTIEDSDAVLFLEEMGMVAPKAPEQPVAEGQRSFYDMIAPTAENIPAYSEQDLADISLRNLERKRKILKKELRKRCG